MTRAAQDELLWPAFESPQDLAEIERIPLSERGLPACSYAALRRAAELWPDEPAISVLPDAERWQEPVTRTFAQLAIDVRRAASVLHDAGVHGTDAVALISVNCDEMITALLAAQAVAIAAPINPALSMRHAADLVELAGGSIILAAGPELDAGAWQLAREVAAATDTVTLLAFRPTGATGAAPPLRPIEGVSVEYFSDRLDRAPQDGMAIADRRWNDDASYLHTGGTTGAPKLAARSHGNEISNAWQAAMTSSLDPGETVLAALPLFHSNAMVLTLIGPLLRGQHVLWAGPLGFRDLPLYGAFWKIVEHHRVAAMSAVPTVYAVLSQVPVDADISVLRYPIVGAAPLPPSVAEGFHRHTGTPLLEGYGLTEGTCASARNWPGGTRSGTVGQRLPYQQMRAVSIDEATGERHDLAPGEIGTIVIKGPNVFAGYLTPSMHGPMKTHSGKIHDGWLDTGDLGSVDADGYVTLAGRAKDLIIRGGHNIDPAVVEDALLEHPAVVAVGAVGQPDAHAGEVPVAFVVLGPGESATLEELAQWAADHAPERAAVPKRVEVVDEIPLTSIGKPFKLELRRRAAEYAAREAIGAAAAVSARIEDGGIVIAVAGPSGQAVDEALAPYGLRWELEHSAAAH